MSVPNYLSFKDLEGVVGFMSAKETNNTAELERILYEHGADTTKPYTISYSLHRPRTSNIPYEGLRVDFSERIDFEWISSGAASLDAIIESNSDRSLIEELHSLNPSRYRESIFQNDLEFSKPLPPLEETVEDLDVVDDIDSELDSELSNFTEQDA